MPHFIPVSLSCLQDARSIWVDESGPFLAFQTPKGIRLLRQVNKKLIHAGELPAAHFGDSWLWVRVAAHPNGKVFAWREMFKILLIDSTGKQREVPMREIIGDGKIQAVAFSRSGRTLWVSYELSPSEQAEAPEDCKHALLVFSYPRLRLKGHVSLCGVSDGAHFITIHPTEEAVGVHVACGQDGLWLTFARFANTSLQSWEYSGPSESFLTGFAPDGRSFGTLVSERLINNSWPEEEIIGEYSLSDEETWNGSEFDLDCGAAWLGDTALLKLRDTNALPGRQVVLREPYTTTPFALPDIPDAEEIHWTGFGSNLLLIHSTNSLAKSRYDLFYVDL